MVTKAKYVLPKLAYELNGLEPVISASLLDLHYNKHHMTYVNNLNLAVEQLQDAMAKNDLSKILSIQPNIVFNGGSHINHSMYWENLAPEKTLGGKFPSPDSAFSKKIVQDWGSYEKFIEYFTKKATGIKGSGWAWLVLAKATKKFEYMETHDQDTPVMTADVVPLLTVDVWEHAYYIDYKNVRAEYLKNIWRIINWDVVEKRFLAAGI